jgi:NAD(P)-dependent dehydrogenase (short-subunit alcohol dehydrogenase family)
MLFRQVEAELGGPDILVNNAGVNASGKQAAEMSIEDWDREIRTDLYGHFYCCRQFIRARRRAGGQGRIINVTSVHEEIARVGSAGYDAANGGLRNLTRTLLSRARTRPHRRQQHRTRQGADADEPEGLGRSGGPRAAGPEHSVEARGRAF